MSKSLYRLPFIVVTALLAAGIAAWAADKSSWEKEAAARKADYIFLESQSAYCSDEFDRYVRLLEKAYDLDSTDIDIAGEWATLAFLDENSDSASLAKSYDLLMRRFRADPTNYINGQIMASIARKYYKFDDLIYIWETLDSIYPTKPGISEELAHTYLIGFIYNQDTSYYDKALGIYDRMMEGSGRNIDISSKLIYAYHMKGDTTAIVNELDSLYAMAPKDSHVALFLGTNYKYIDMPQEAIKYFNLACELDSTDGNAFLQRARFYNEINDSVAFDREVFLALRSQNLDIDSKLGILRSYVSELYTDSTQQPRIRQLFNELQLMHPGEAEIHELFGAYLYEIEDYKDASDQFSYVVALEPNDEQGWLQYVQTLALTDDTTTVIDNAMVAMDKFPENLYFPIIATTVYRINNQYDKALEIFKMVDLDKVKNPQAKSNFLTSEGDTYSMLGDTIKALEIYDEAIKLNPDNNMALNNAAYFITLTHGDLDKAERYSQQSLRGQEDNATYLDTYAWVMFMKKDYPLAKMYIDMAMNAAKGTLEAADDDSAVGSVNVVPEEIMEGEGAETGSVNASIDDAVVEDEAFAALLSADIYDHAGDIYFMNGDTDKALKFWEKAHELDPDDKIIEKKVTHKTIFFR